MNSHLNAPSSNHCACCHVCHVSMRQRPRPAVGCSTCKTILCDVCCRERFPNDIWEAAANTPGWQCPKCTQSCVCKSCKAKGSKPRASAPSKRRAAPVATAAVSEMEWQPEDEEEGAEEGALFSVAGGAFSAPRRKKKKKKVKRKRRPSSAAAARAASAPPPRGPSPPEMHASYGMTFSPMAKRGRLVNSLERAPQSVGLGFLHDTAAPIHLKILELQKAKETSQRTIAEMRNLLSLMELEQREVEAALNGLIQQAARQTAAAAPKGMFKSASACSLQQLEVQAEAQQSSSNQAALGH